MWLSEDKDFKDIWDVLLIRNVTVVLKDKDFKENNVFLMSIHNMMYRVGWC